MPYKDKQQQKEYQRQWMAARREEFFSDKVCTRCGSKEGLELHHLDPKQKENHRIWSWSEERRNAEIKKCAVVCKNCHQAIHGKGTTTHGTPSGYRYGCRCTPCRDAHLEKMRKYKTQVRF